MEPKYGHIRLERVVWDGNGFYLVGRVAAALRAAGIPRKEIERFREEAMRGSYLELVATVRRWVTFE